ncbi:MAG: hypothetical protein RBU37_22210 [Myxococcota bacterium]|jgi:photosystem II stability/assembly factor-like uncharacterized protein|nr:hypothetical protein [Myxococcota bacterium]
MLMATANGRRPEEKRALSCRWSTTSLGLLAFSLLCVLCSNPTALQAADLVWLDVSTGALTSGVTAVAIAPDDPAVMYAAGRSYVARSDDGGATWQPTLLLAGSAAALEDDDALDEVDAQDVSRFDDSETLFRFEEMRDQLYEELADEYGEELAEEMVLGMDDQLREEAYWSLLDDVGEYEGEFDYVSRKQRLQEAGFADEEAELLAADPVAVWELVVLPEAPAHVYAATGRGLYRSIDYGKRWQLILRASADTEHGRGVLSVGVSQQGKRIVAGTVRGLMYSDDGGRSFSQPLGELGSRPVRKVHATIDENRFYALSLDGLFVSEDGAATFSELRTSFDVENVRDLAVLPDDADGVLVSSARLVLQSLDGGQSFEALPSAGLDASGLGRLHIPVSDTGSVYVLGDTDVFSLGPQEKSWQRQSNGLLGQQCFSLSSDSDGQLWLGSSTGLLQAVQGEKAAVQMELLKQLQQIWAAEPEPGKVVRAALAFHRLDSIDTEAWVSREFWSRWAPRVDVRLSIRQERREHEGSSHLLFTPGEPATVDNLLTQNRDIQLYGRDPNLIWNVMAWWDFGELLSDSTELLINSLRIQVYKAQKRLAFKVIKLYIKRRALQAQLASGKKHKLKAQVTNLLKLEEMTAMLDAYSGNYFTTAYHAASSHLRSPQADLREEREIVGLPPIFLVNQSLGMLDEGGNRQ